MALNFAYGDLLSPYGHGSKIIAHLEDISGEWSDGLSKAISKKWRRTEKKFKKWKRLHEKGRAQKPFVLGQVQIEDVTRRSWFFTSPPTLWIATIISMDSSGGGGYRRSIRYGALEKGLRRLCSFAHVNSAYVHLPKISRQYGSADWKIVEKMIREISESYVSVIVHDV